MVQNRGGVKETIKVNILTKIPAIFIANGTKQLDKQFWLIIRPVEIVFGS